MASVDQLLNNRGTNLAIARVAYGDRTLPTSLVSIPGITISEPEYSSSTEDDSAYGDGLAGRQKKSSVQATYQIEGLYIVNTAQQSVLYPLASNTSEAKDEAYLRITYGNGDEDRFFAVIENYRETVQIRTFKRFSFTATVNGPVIREIDNTPIVDGGGGTGAGSGTGTGGQTGSGNTGGNADTTAPTASSS